MSSYNNESKERNIGTKEIALSGLLLSVAFICSNIKLAQMPMGGSVTMLSMVFISLIGYLFGVKIGLISALAYGFLQLSFGGYVMHPLQMLFDYPIAFMCLGFSGIFRNKTHGLRNGYMLGCLCKYLCHVFTGVVFFSETGAPLISSITYSLTYNAYILPEVVITVLLIPVLLPYINKHKITLN